MELPSEVIEERLKEIHSYLSFLKSIETATTRGAPRLEGVTEPISVEQQRILYSSVYLQLYSLVESTVTQCLDFVTISSLDGHPWVPSDLSDQLRREWVRQTAKTHVDLNFDNRLVRAVELCNHMVQQLPVGGFKIEKNAGNWDDNKIEEITSRLGCQLAVPPDAYSAIKRIFRQDRGALALVKWLRNQLSHGEISFAECGEGITAGELEELTNLTANYLRGIAASFEAYVESHSFLQEDRRPAGQT